MFTERFEPQPQMTDPHKFSKNWLCYHPRSFCNISRAKKGSLYFSLPEPIKKAFLRGNELEQGLCKVLLRKKTSFFSLVVNIYLGSGQIMKSANIMKYFGICLTYCRKRRCLLRIHCQVGFRTPQMELS
jgi:hypothetical protein